VDLPALAGRRPRQDAVRRFLYLGRLSTNIERDVPTLLRAFDRLASDLSDVELAAVATYVKNSFGNKAGEVQPADFKAARK
jgi:glycosyltransferase involved in cell wall biosynthesis